MMIRRSQKEQTALHQERESLAKRIAQTLVPLTNPLRTQSDFVEQPQRPAPSTNTAVQRLGSLAIQHAKNRLAEAGITGIQLSPLSVNISEQSVGGRMQLIRKAAVQLKATFPTTDGFRVAQKEFLVNLGFSNGKYSLDNLQLGAKTFPVHKDFIRLAASSTADIDMACDEFLKGRGQDITPKLRLKEEEEEKPVGEEREATVPEKPNTGAASDPENFASLKAYIVNVFKEEAGPEPLDEEGKLWLARIPTIQKAKTLRDLEDEFVEWEGDEKIEKILDSYIEEWLAYGRKEEGDKKTTASADPGKKKLVAQAKTHMCKGCGRQLLTGEGNECHRCVEARQEEARRARPANGEERKAQAEKFCFSVPTMDGRHYSVWKTGKDEAEARKKLCDEVGKEFGMRARIMTQHGAAKTNEENDKDEESFEEAYKGDTVKVASLVLKLLSRSREAKKEVNPYAIATIKAPQHSKKWKEIVKGVERSEDEKKD